MLVLIGLALKECFICGFSCIDYTYLNFSILAELDWNTEIPFHGDSFVSEKKKIFVLKKGNSSRQPS